MSKSLVSELLEDATSRRFVPALSTGVVASILFIIFQVSFAAMVYSGSLSPLATRGAGLTLCGGLLICLFAALTSSFKATVSFPQDAPAAVLSTVAITIVATLGEKAPMEARFMTVAAVLALSAFLTGAVFIIIGKFRLANLLRFMPFPVVGGFLAGTGWLFVAGGMAVMCGMPISPGTLSRLAAPDMILRWLPGVVYGAALFAITLRYSHFLILPGSLVAGVVLFYIVFAVGGTSIESAKAAGLLVSTALIVGGVLFIGGGLLEYFPKALLGGMLLLLGFSLIHEWIVTGRRRLPLPDYLIVTAIFLVIGLFGFLEGVAFGLVAAVIFFVIRFSRVPVVGNEFNAMDRRSVKERPVPHRKVLSAGGERIRGYELTGYIFFGSAATLVESLKGALGSEPHPDFILLDFAHVSGLDISAVNNFHRFALNARAANTAIAITAAPDHFTAAMKLNLPEGAEHTIAFFPDLDHGLEWCEDRLLERAFSKSGDQASAREALFDQSVDEVMAHLERQERFEHLVDSLAPWLEHREHPAGSAILKKGEPAGGLHLLTWGAATEIDPDTGVRLCGLTPGSVIAAPAAFGGFTASTTIRADSDCKTAFLSLEARGLLEREAPGLAIALHGFIIGSRGA